MAKNEATLLIRIKQAGGEILTKMGSALESVAEKAMYVATAVIGFGAAAIASYKEAEQASNELTQSMINQGIYTTDLKAKYDAMASSLEKTTTFGDDAITSAQAQLQAYLGQTEVTEDLVKATLDLATAKGIDLKSASDLIGKTISTETNALMRQGIEIDNTATKNEKLAQVISQVSAKYGGQAEAAAKGLGALEQLKNTADNFLEAVGERLAPFITFFTRQLNDFTNSLINNANFMRGIESVINGVSVSFVYLKNFVLGAAEALGTGLGGALEASALLLQGKFSQAKDMAMLAMEEIKTGTIERVATMNEELAMLEDLKQQKDEEQRLAEETKIQQSLERKQAIKDSADQTAFTKEQLYQAKMLGIELKKSEDLKKLDEARVAARRDTLNTIASLQSANNSTLAAIGKAAGITQIAIDTPIAISKALAAFPPPFNFAAAGLVGAAMAAQAARIAGVPLAEGGIVKATNGGIPAIIGEGGQDEAVIPLDRAGEFGMGGGGVTVNFNGPIMGNESQAQEFAIAIDRQLLKLRQSNQSVAFDTGVI